LNKNDTSINEKNVQKEPLIRFAHVFKAFGRQKVCNDFNLQVHAGETLVIIGPSGVGKTVTIKMLIGLVLPDSGDIWFDGVNVAKFERDKQFLPIRKRVAMVFQSSALFDSMTVFDNIAYPLREHSQMSPTELRDTVLEKLEWVGLPDAAFKMPSELSGGMKKRIGLARAIVANPEVILYDEPTAGLDPINTVRIADVIMDLKERIKCTSIVVTHDIPVAERLSDRAAFLYDGKVKALGTVAELAESSDRYVKGFLAGDSSLAD